MSGQRLTLGPDQIGDVGLALLTLTHEVWQVTARLRTLEAVLARHGIDAAAEIEDFEPDAGFAAGQTAAADALANRILSALAGVAPANPLD